MKKILSIASFCFLFTFSALAGNVLSFSTSSDTTILLNQLSKAEKAKGWQLLFDGKSTKGWHIYQNKSDGSAWKVVNGELTFVAGEKVNGKIVGSGDMVSDSTYENYHFSVEWKVSEKGNSGIIFNASEDAKYEYAFHTGPEMQVLDNDGHSDGKLYRHRAGDLYDLVAVAKENAKGPGEWNKAEIMLKNRKLDLYLNGLHVVSTVMGSPEWDKMVAKSKFKSMPDFGKIIKGHIVLQDHGNPIWFRNIKIRKL
jgi:hypothetical protein